jgi:hypothetical protein
MRKLSRRQNENIKKIKKSVYSDLDEALTVLKETATSKILILNMLINNYVQL